MEAKVCGYVVPELGQDTGRNSFAQAAMGKRDASLCPC